MLLNLICLVKLPVFQHCFETVMLSSQQVFNSFDLLAHLL